MSLKVACALSVLAALFMSDGFAERQKSPSVAAILYQVVDAANGEKSFQPGDFNKDGHVDLVIAEEYGNRVVVFVNDGAGKLIREAAYPAGPNPSWLAAQDFDMDGAVDLVIVNHEESVITLLRGSDAATFDRRSRSTIAIATQPHSHMIKIADIDGDGIADIVADSRDKLGIFILRGDGEDGFDSPGHGVDVGGTPYLGFVIADFNSDGKPDIATPNRNEVGVLLNRSSEDPAFDKATSIPFRSAFAVGAADLDGDETIDLIAASVSETPGVVAFAGDGAGGFERLITADMAQGAKLIATGDVNADGIADAVITSWNSEAVLLVGDSQEPYFIQLSLQGIQNAWGLALADFDSDGRDEIVVGDASSHRVHVYKFSELNE